MYLNCFESYVKNAGTVVDVGCGSGVFSRAFENNQHLIVALDLDRSQLRKHKGRIVERVCGDAHCLPFYESSVDCVLSISIMEHLLKPDLYTKEVHRILRENGVLVVQLPNLQYPVEPHTKWPLLFILPKSLQSKVLNMLDYAYVNMNFTVKQALKLLGNEGLKLIKSEKLYHLKIMKLFPMAPSYIFILEKRQ